MLKYINLIFILKLIGLLITSKFINMNPILKRELIICLLTLLELKLDFQWVFLRPFFYPMPIFHCGNKAHSLFSMGRICQLVCLTKDDRLDLEWYTQIFSCDDDAY